MLKQLLESSARLDERVKSLIEQRGELNKRLNAIDEDLEDLTLRVTKLEVVAARSETNLQRWFSWGMQLVYAIVASYLIWKFGLNGSLPP